MMPVSRRGVGGGFHGGLFGKRDDGEKMRFCIFGYGSIAGVHRDALIQIPGVEFDSVVGRLIDPAREFAEDSGASFATVDMGEALQRPGLDAVLIASPSSAHFGQAKQALGAGKDVLVEIPMALSFAEAEELCKLADENKKLLMICHTQRFYASSIEVKRRITDGVLTPRHFHVEFEYLRRENTNWQGRMRSWTDNILWHHGGHVIDLAIWLFREEPESVNAYFGPDDNPLGVPLDMSAQMSFPGGGLATYAMSYNAMVPRESERMTLICDEDLLRWHDLRVTDHLDRLVKDEPFAEAVLRQDREFVEAVRARREPLASGREILRSWRHMDRLEASARPT